MAIVAQRGNHTEALTYFHDEDTGFDLKFQDGPIMYFGINGTTNEEVIGVLVDRLRSLQAMSDGKFACRENALAIMHLEEALHWLQARTAARLARNVEGTDIP